MKDSSAQSAEFESPKKRTDAHRRGYEFQPFVGNLFRAQHFKVEEKAGISTPRQVDLLATRGEEVYLIETKWQQDPADIDDVDALFTRLEPVPPGVVGLLVSFSGFTQSVIDKVKEESSRPVLLVSEVEIEQALGWSGDFISLLRRKRSALLTHRRVLIDEVPEPRSNEVPEGFICGPSGPVEVLRAHLVLVGDRVLPKGDPQLTHPTLDLTLRSTHESKRSEILGFVLGFSWGQQKGRCATAGPDLLFL
jgi:hypothetical protein